MDLFVRAVDWVVTRTALEETSASAANVSSWDWLPGDIFTALLSHFHTSADREALKNLRCVCTTWKQHVDTRLQSLSIRINEEFSQTQISEKFSSLRKLAVHAAFDAPLQNAPFMNSVLRCRRLERLILRNCKGRVMHGMQQLHQCPHLKELIIDGDVFQKMHEEDIQLTNLESLAVHNCSSFCLEDYKHLKQFPSLHRLLLTHVTANWKEVCGEFLDGMKELVDLTVMQYTAQQESLSFSCLRGATCLRRLVLFESGINLESFQSFPSLPLLEHLSLDGCMELTPLCLQTLATKFPRLTSVSIACPSEAWVTRDFSSLPKMPCLKELKLVNSYGLDVVSLKSAMHPTVHVSTVRIPELALQRVTKMLDYHAIEAFLKSACQPGTLVSGEYFTPSLLSDLAAKGRYDLMQLLTEYGADIDYGNPAYSLDADDSYDCSTALHFAVHRGDVHGVRSLLDLGARVDAHCTEDGRTPLHLAAASGNVEVTKLLLAAHADVNAFDGSNRTPLHVAVTWRAREIITELLRNGADPHVVDLDLLAPMCYAARMADLDLLRFMVGSGMDVNEGACYEFSTPLHVAVRSGKWKIIRFLLENGADPCAKDVDGAMPLLLAARYGHATLVESLLESLEPRAEDLNERDSTGNTLLHYAASNGWYSVVEKLIKLGVDVNRTDPKGFTALYYADQQRHSKIVGRLTREGGLARWLTRPKLYRCPRIGRHARW